MVLLGAPVVQSPFFDFAITWMNNFILLKNKGGYTYNFLDERGLSLWLFLTHCSIHILNLNGDKVINALHIIVSGLYAIQGTIVIYPPVRLAWLVLEQ